MTRSFCRTGRTDRQLAGGFRDIWARLAAEGDRGSSSVELVIVTTLLMLLITLVVQFALYFCALHVAQAAVAEAAADAGSEHGTADAGTAQAREILATAGSGFFAASDVTVARTAATTTVRISGTVTSIVPFLHLKVGSTAHAPNETLTGVASRDRNAP